MAAFSLGSDGIILMENIDFSWKNILQKMKDIALQLENVNNMISSMKKKDEEIKKLKEENSVYKTKLNMLQKKLKYGVANQTAISICEKVFYDRLLAMKISGIIGIDNLSPNEIIGAIILKKDAILSCLEKYPAYFEDKLRFLI